MPLQGRLARDIAEAEEKLRVARRTLHRKAILPHTRAAASPLQASGGDEIQAAAGVPLQLRSSTPGVCRVVGVEHGLGKH